MPQQTTKAGLKLNRELRKAVHSGDQYEEYKTTYQYNLGYMAWVREIISRMEAEIDAYYADGGALEVIDEHDWHLVIGDTEMDIRLDDDGNVQEYTRRHVHGHMPEVRRMQMMFFAANMLPIYKQILETVQECQKDLDDANIVKGLSEIREIIRGDKYLTVAAVSGVGISEEEDIDPFRIFTDDGGDSL